MIKSLKEKNHSDDSIELYSEYENDLNLGVPEEANFNELSSQEFGNNYIGAKLLILNGNNMLEAKVTSMKKNTRRSPIRKLKYKSFTRYEGY